RPEVTVAPIRRSAHDELPASEAWVAAVDVLRVARNLRLIDQRRQAQPFARRKASLTRLVDDDLRRVGYHPIHFRRRFSSDTVACCERLEPLVSVRDHGFDEFALRGP